MAMFKTGAPSQAVNEYLLQGYKDGLIDTYNPNTSDASAIVSYKQGFELGKQVKEGKATAPSWAN